MGWPVLTGLTDGAGGLLDTRSGLGRCLFLALLWQDLWGDGQGCYLRLGRVWSLHETWNSNTLIASGDFRKRGRVCVNLDNCCLPHFLSLEKEDLLAWSADQICTYRQKAEILMNSYVCCLKNTALQLEEAGTSREGSPH